MIPMELERARFNRFLELWPEGYRKDYREPRNARGHLGQRRQDPVVAGLIEVLDREFPIHPERIPIECERCGRSFIQPRNFNVHNCRGVA